MPSRWPGKCSPRNRQDHGVRIGKGCSTREGKRCRQRGKGSCWLLGDGTPVGGGTRLWRGAGIRSYASMWGPKPACPERRPLSGSVDGFPLRERVGRAKWNVLPAKKGRVNGTLLMPWEAGYESAWVILTKLEPEEALVSWYGLRTWLEGGFKHFKRGLWGWHQSKNEPAASLPERHIAHRRRKRAVGQLPARRLSCVVRARLILLAMQSRSEPLAVGILRARPWPQTITAPQKQRTPSALKKKQTQKEKERRKRQKRRAREHARATG